MRYLFITSEQYHQSRILLCGPEVHHLSQVLRLRVGDPLRVTDGSGFARDTKISEINKREITLDPFQIVELPPERRLKISVAQALGKSDKFEQVMQHGTEVGVTDFVPINTERSVIKFDPSSYPSKRERWTSILKGAAEQSGRAAIPIVHDPLSFIDLVKTASNYDICLLLHPEGYPLTAVCRKPEFQGAKRILLIVGPEGGFSQSEISLAEEVGITTTTLGPHVLRTETAALVAAGQILFASEWQHLS